MKTQYIVISIAVAIFVVGGIVYFAVGQKSSTNTLPNVASNQGKNQVAESATLPAGATADADGFVRMPGEPSRGGNTYYVTGDVCEQFTIKYMEGLTGKHIFRTSSVTPGSSVCQYFISEQNKNMMFQIDVGFFNVEDQKKGQEFLGRRVESDKRIPMENFVVYQENGLINKIYLVLGPDKFVGIDRSAADALAETEIMDLAIKLGNKLKDFK